MTVVAQFILEHPVLRCISTENLDDPRGSAGTKTIYGLEDGSTRAVLVVLKKLPALELDAKGGIAAISDRDATMHAISYTIDLFADLLPRARWISDLDDHLDRFQHLSTWQTVSISIDGQPYAAFGYNYESAKSIICDLGIEYIVLAINPAVETPKLASVAE